MIDRLEQLTLKYHTGTINKTDMWAMVALPRPIKSHFGASGNARTSEVLPGYINNRGLKGHLFRSKREA